MPQNPHKIKLADGVAPMAIPYMPPGEHVIQATAAGKPIVQRVIVDAAACARLNADLAEKLAASRNRQKPRPVIYFDHERGDAAAYPARFFWDDEKGILLELLSWSDTGRAKVEGHSYGYVSPCFRVSCEDGQVLGLSEGIEVASLVNDPAFETIAPIMQDIAASKSQPPPAGVCIIGGEPEWVAKTKMAGRRGISPPSDPHKESTPGTDILAQNAPQSKQKMAKGRGLSPLSAPPKGSALDRVGMGLSPTLDISEDPTRSTDILAQNAPQSKPKDDFLHEIFRKAGLDIEQNTPQSKPKMNESATAQIPSDPASLVGHLSLVDGHSLHLSPRDKVAKMQSSPQNTNNAANQGAPSTMIEEIKNQLGLPAETEDAEVLAAIAKLIEERDAAKAQADSALAESKKKEEELQAARAQQAEAFSDDLVKRGLIAPKDEAAIQAARALFAEAPELAGKTFASITAAHSVDPVISPAVPAPATVGARTEDFISFA